MIQGLILCYHDSSILMASRVIHSSFLFSTVTGPCWVQRALCFEFHHTSFWFRRRTFLWDPPCHGQRGPEHAGRGTGNSVWESTAVAVTSENFSTNILKSGSIYSLVSAASNVVFFPLSWIRRRNLSLKLQGWICKREPKPSSKFLAFLFSHGWGAEPSVPQIRTEIWMR